MSYDINLIKQEQANTKQDKNSLDIANKYTNIFSFLIIGFLITSIITLCSYSLFKNINILTPLTILTFLLILAVTLIYLIRKKIHFELALNVKKQAKLMSILNKKTVIYSHYLNFLNFAYKKYEVKNAKMLEENIKNYPEYKNIIFRYDSLKKLLEETKYSLQNFINEKNINIKDESMEFFAKSINIENKISYSKEIKEKKLKSKEKLNLLEKDFTQNQKEIEKLNEKDSSKENIIARIINYYLKELEDINNLKTYSNFLENLDNLDNDDNEN